MRRTKVYLPAAAKTAAEPALAAARPVLRAAAGPAPKPPAPKPPAAPGQARQAEVNRTADYVAAGVVPAGKPAAAGRVELVAPGAAYAPPPGLELRCFLHRDGSAVKFAGAAGEVYLDRQEAQSEFGALLPSALALLAANPAPTRERAPAKPPPPKKPAAPPPVRRAVETTTAPTADAADAVRHAAGHGTGTPLPAATRAKLEASYGADLGQVRVHTDTAASDAARAVHAHAFTTGQDVFFRAGQYSPGTAAGEKLLAHEVAHTVQQAAPAGGVARQADASELEVSEPGDRVEREAEAAAERAVRGQPVTVRPSGPAVARLADGPAPGPQAAPAPAAPAAKGPAPAPKPAGPPGAPAAPPPAKGAKAEAEPKAEKPAEKDGLQAVVAGVSAAGHEQKQHDPAEQKATEAQEAVGVSPEHAQGEGKRQQVDAMSGQKPGAFNRKVFKERLREKIQGLQAGDAEDIKDDDKAQGVNDAVKAEVAQGKQEAAGAIDQAAKQEPPAGPPPAPGAELPAAEPGAAPQVDGSRAAPPPVPDEQVSLAAESQGLDEQMAAAKVTPEQLQKANEPEFQAAADAKTAAQAQADALPAQARANEQQVRAKAKGEAAATTQAGLAEMHGKRAEGLTAALGQQAEGKGKHEGVKQRLAERFDAIYTRTKTAVDERLAKLDADVATAFDEGASAAKRGFYAFIVEELLGYVARKGLVRAVIGALTDDEEYVAIFERGRRQFTAGMEVAIDRVADVVEAGLNDVVGIIARGKVELDAEVAKLPAEEQAVGREVAQGVQGKFADLEKSVEEKQQQIINSVAEKYVAAQKDIDSVIKFLKDPIGAAIDYAKEAIAGVIETLNKMRELLMGVLAKAGEAIDLILADPIGFVGNLAAGVKQGLMNFVANIGTHLQKGLFEWLFGALAQAGIQIPDKFDLSGILSIVLQVLGLTWQNIRKRAVAIVGEKVVSALETASEIIVTLVTKGPAGLWEYIKEKASDLLQSVLDGIKSFLIEKVIVAGVTWIIGLLNPASAFVKACKAIYDIIMWVVTNGQQLLEFVNAVLDSVLSIARGQIGVAAAAVEKALAKAVPVAIGFLAGLLGLGGLSEKIKEVIAKIQAPINAAIDWVINKAVALAKAVGKMLGFGKKDEKPDDRTPEQKAADRDNALADAEKLFNDSDATVEWVQKELEKIRSRHRVAVLELVEDQQGEEESTVHVVAQNSDPKKGATHKLATKVKIKLHRPSGFRAATKNELRSLFPEQHKRGVKDRALVKVTEARRHIIPSQDYIIHLEQTLNGLDPAKAKVLLEAKDVVVEGLTSKAIQAAAQALLREFFNDIENLWVGNSVENSTIQDAWDFPHGWSAEKIDSHIEKIKKKYLLR